MCVCVFNIYILYIYRIPRHLKSVFDSTQVSLDFFFGFQISYQTPHNFKKCYIRFSVCFARELSTFCVLIKSLVNKRINTFTFIHSLARTRYTVKKVQYKQPQKKKKKLPSYTHAKTTTHTHTHGRERS